LFADVLVTLFRLVHQRVAWVVPLIGCIAQLAVAFGAAAMESLAARSRALSLDATLLSQQSHKSLLVSVALTH
jgi:hypothetical protein